MKKKYKNSIMIIILLTVLIGCSQKENDKSPAQIKDTATKNTATENTTTEDIVVFPDRYNTEMERVKFQCELEIPEGFTGLMQDYHVNEQVYCDSNKFYEMFAPESELKEHHTNPVSEGLPEDNTYIFADGTTIASGFQCLYNSINNIYYNQLGVMDSIEISSNEKLSFAEPETCIEDVNEILRQLGYPADDFFFSWHSLNAQAMEQAEEQLISSGDFPDERRKKGWTSEDDIYVIYAYQKCGTLPVFHEIMSLGRSLAYDTPSGAPVQAVYSVRGLESLLVNNIYAFEKAEKNLHLKNFDEIAKVVEEKFNSILNEADYAVTRAKLYERVYYDEKQNYAVEPTWYFEIIENGNESRTSVTLVNAVTGKEIYLP